MYSVKYIAKHIWAVGDAREKRKLRRVRMHAQSNLRSGRGLRLNCGRHQANLLVELDKSNYEAVISEKELCMFAPATNLT